MSKGSARRPGAIKPGVWEAIFAPVVKECLTTDLSIPEPKIDTSGERVDSVNVTEGVEP